jgi:hypothetical protein
MTPVQNMKWIAHTKINAVDCLQFNFQGILTQKQSLEACNEWLEISKANIPTKYEIIFDSLKMENYEPQARINFQKTIKELSGQITKIWVITDSKIISGGAAIMGVFSSFPIKAVTSECQIKIV